MDATDLTPERLEHAERIYRALRQATDADLRKVALLLASKPDSQLLGPTEFEVRDRVHAIGAKAIEIAVNDRKGGLPGFQPELPPLSQGGPLRRLPAQGVWSA